MNKTPIFTIVALLAVVLMIFSGCEFEISLDGENNTETSIESVVVTDEVGSTQIETIVHHITTEAVPVVTVIEVTNEKGKVVETEKVTLSPEEVQQGKEFFDDVTFPVIDKVSTTENKSGSKTETTKKNSNKKPGNKQEQTTKKDKDSNKKTTSKKETTTRKNTSDNNNSKVTTTKKVNATKVPSTTKKVNTEDKTTKPAVTTKPAATTKPVSTTKPVPTTQQPIYQQDDMAILRSDKYLIVGRAVTPEGVSYPYKMARDGNRFTFKSVFEGEEICLIVGSEYVYLLSPKTKTYSKLSRELIQEESSETGEFDDLLSGDAFNLYADKKQVDTYTEKMDGVKYTVVEYDDGTYDYFIGKKLYHTMSSDGSILYYDQISSNVTEGLFIPPADYKEEAITAEQASEMAAALSTEAYAD